MDIYYDEEKEAWREYKPYATIDVATEEDYRTLLKAIEREKAKKPMKAIDESGIKYTACPLCGAVVQSDGFSFNYCPDCGQKLDWRNADGWVD